MKTRSTSNLVFSLFFVAWAAVFAVLALDSRWWLLAAFPMSVIGVLGLATELARPKGTP